MSIIRPLPVAFEEVAVAYNAALPLVLLNGQRYYRCSLAAL